MTRLNQLILLFSILFVIFIVGPALLDYSFPLYPLMMISDAFDLLTPLVLIPIYWLLYELHPDKQPNRRENLIFLVFASLWILGQGMHLAANSISHLIEPKTVPTGLFLRRAAKPLFMACRHDRIGSSSA